MFKIQLKLFIKFSYFMLLSTSFVCYVTADICHEFQSLRIPEFNSIYRSTYISDYCSNSQSNVCCSIVSVANYKYNINSINYQSSNSACRQISRELMCHIGCSPSLSIDFNSNLNKFRPQFTYKYIKNFMTTCRNSIWCGTWQAQNHTSTTGCYTVNRGKIIHNKNNYISSNELSVAEFAREILDAEIGGTEELNPPVIAIDSRGKTYPVLSILLFSLVSILVTVLLLKL